MAAPANFAAQPHRSGWRPRRQHGYGRSESLQRDRGVRSGQMDEDSGHRLRWHAENRASLGAEWKLGGHDLYSSKYGSGDRDVGGGVQVRSDSARTKSDGAGVDSVPGGVDGDGQDGQGGEGVGLAASE